MDSPRFVDTNVLIRFYTQDDPDKLRSSRSLIARLVTGQETATLSHLVIFECVYILQKSYGMPKASIRGALEALLVLKSLRVDDRNDLIEALAIYDEQNISFADAYNAVFMRRHGIDEVYSWGKDFDRISWVTRVEPS